MFQEDNEPKPFRDQASIRIIEGVTQDPFEPNAENSGGSRFVPREAEHSHEVGKEKDLVIVDVDYFKQAAFLSLYQILENAYILNISLFSVAEKDILERDGVVFVQYDENNFVIVNFQDVSLTDLINKYQNQAWVRKLQALKTDHKFPILFGDEAETRGVAVMAAQKYFELIKSIPVDELDTQLRYSLLSHELEHLRSFLQYSGGLSLEQLSRYLGSLSLGLGVRRPEIASDNQDLIDLDQLKSEINNLIVKVGTYSEALSILVGLSHHVSPGTFKLEATEGVLRSLRFFQYFQEKSSETALYGSFGSADDEGKIHYALATLSIFFKKDLLVEEKLPTSEEILNKIEEIVKNSENWLTYKEWQSLYDLFGQRMAIIYQELREKFTKLQALQEKLQIPLVKPFVGN